MTQGFHPRVYLHKGIKINAQECVQLHYLPQHVLNNQTTEHKTELYAAVVDYCKLEKCSEFRLHTKQSEF